MNDDKIKAFYKSKTIIFSILVAIFGVLQMQLGQGLYARHIFQC